MDKLYIVERVWECGDGYHHTIIDNYTIYKDKIVATQEAIKLVIDFHNNANRINIVKITEDDITLREFTLF